MTGSTTSNLISHLAREDHSNDYESYLKNKETENSTTPKHSNKRPRFLDSPLANFIKRT